MANPARGIGPYGCQYELWRREPREYAHVFVGPATLVPKWPDRAAFGPWEVQQ